MSKIEVDQITQQSGTTLTIGGGACKTATVDATTINIGRCGGTVALASGASQSGFGRTGTVDWETTPKTSTFTAVSGDGFFCNTTAGAFTCNLPAGSAGAIVSLMDYAGTWADNNLTVSPNGSEKIGGQNADLILSTEGQSVTLLYVDSTQGWLNIQDSTSNERANPFIVATGGTITTSGNCKIHTFTGPGTFTVCTAAQCSANNQVSYIVVAGGAGGGTAEQPGHNGGGGGAGGYRETKSPVTPYTASPLDGQPSAPNRITVSATAYPITVGGGGAGSTLNANRGVDGSNSIFSTITAAGGGGGAGPVTPVANGQPGGSGGGGSSQSTPAGSPGFSQGGTGNTPPVTPPQGNNGGAGDDGPPGQLAAGGGGGATAVGADGSNSSSGGNGGAGATSCISGSPVARAGGGGGGGNNGNGSGGTGGGGNASASGSGTANTGGGGGAGITSGTPAGNAGGSGVVIIRYKFK